VGSLCALAHARRGIRVALFEASPNKNRGLKGEWMHPPAARMLQQAGVHFDDSARATRGFVVFPEDGSEMIPLTYPDGSRGLVCPHETLVMGLREAANNEPNVNLIQERAQPLHDGSVTYTRDGVEESVTADRIVGADGRGSVILRLLGLTQRPTVRSRMLGVMLNGAKLPLEDYGHLFCGGPGPIFMYRLAHDSVCAVVDIPHRYSSRQTADLLLNSYVPSLPIDIRPLFIEAVHEHRFKFAGNTIRPRISYGNSRFVVIGDAAGHYHPMTAVGLTLGFGDAMTLAEHEDFDDFLAARFREVRAPEMLAMGFYEIFADHRAESMALRQAIYRIWRTGGAVSDRSVRLLACNDTSATSLGFVGAMVVALAVGKIIPRSARPRPWWRSGSIVYRLASRVGWFIRAVEELRRSRRRGDLQNEKFYDNMARVFLVSIPSQDGSSEPSD
jgi:2-polyprenyl-6-methoxyphenol hydroxylase-like FAD-dependent oxidoreductase